MSPSSCTQFTAHIRNTSISLSGDLHTRTQSYMYINTIHEDICKILCMWRVVSPANGASPRTLHTRTWSFFLIHGICLDSPDARERSVLCTPLRPSCSACARRTSSLSLVLMKGITDSKTWGLMPKIDLAPYGRYSRIPACNRSQKHYSTTHNRQK
jgi:hypothetical protein